MSVKAKPKEEKEKEKEKERGRGAWDIYKIENGAVKLTNRKCQRCGKVMAFHKNPQARWSCGGCQYTEYAKR
jgi:small subunit ribosomal protein S27Ae